LRLLFASCAIFLRLFFHACFALFFRDSIVHWSEIRLDNASIVSKSEAASHRLPPNSGPHFCIDTKYRYYSMVQCSFSRFLTWLGF
jgi:hypothetical protein